MKFDSGFWTLADDYWRAPDVDGRPPKTGWQTVGKMAGRWPPSSVYCVEGTLYSFGDYGTNVCPSGSVKLTEQVECEVAANEFGADFFTWTISKSDFPGGCFEGHERVYFNTR